MTDRNSVYAQTLSKMIRCKTVSSREVGQKGFPDFLQLIRELFPHIFNVAEYRDYNGCIVLIWRGKSSDKPVLFMNHHDVVPADGKWSHSPFGAEIDDGKIWGRGTLDTKGGLFGMLQAADELAESGFVPSRDIWFESSCCEEIAGDNIGCDVLSLQWKNEGIHFDWCLDEGGMIVFEPFPGAKGNFAMVGVAEKCCSDLKFTARSNGGHASTPHKNSPLVRLGKFMAYIEKHNPFDAELTPVTCEMFRQLSKKLSGPLKFILSHPVLFKPVLIPILSSIPATNAFLRTTLAFTCAHGSEAYNVIPQQAYVTGNMRFSHHQGRESSIDAVKKIAERFDIETEIINHGVDSDVSSFTSSAFNMIRDALSSVYTDVITSPYIQTGASDSRFMCRVCDNCYRFVPFEISNSQLGTIHGIDENVDVSTLAPAVDFYKYLMTHL